MSVAINDFSLFVAIAIIDCRSAQRRCQPNTSGKSARARRRSARGDNGGTTASASAPTGRSRRHAIMPPSTQVAVPAAADVKQCKLRLAKLADVCCARPSITRGLLLRLGVRQQSWLGASGRKYASIYRHGAKWQVRIHVDGKVCSCNSCWTCHGNDCLAQCHLKQMPMIILTHDKPCTALMRM